MKLLFQASADEHAGAEAVLLEFKPQQCARLLKVIKRVQAFLPTISRSHYCGSVEILSPFTQTIVLNEAPNDYDWPDNQPLRLPDDWEPAELDIWRSECHYVKIYRDGDCFLTAISKHGSFRVTDSGGLNLKTLRQLAAGKCPFPTFEPAKIIAP